MSEQSIPARPFFQPLPEHDDLQTAYLLRKVAQHVDVLPNGCWVWNGATTDKGYEKFGIGGRGTGRTKMVHRTVYQLCVADTPRKMYVCHSCDNPPCCNPAHLWLGHHQDNVDDMMLKGRHRTDNPKGQDHHNTKFTDETIRYIRRRAASDEYGVIAHLAKELGVGKACIRHIVKRRSWQHITDEPEGGAA